MLILKQAFPYHLGKNEQKQKKQKWTRESTDVHSSKTKVFLLLYWSNLVGHLSFEIHGQFDHVVVRRTREENLSCVKLVQGATHWPHINAIIIRLPDDYTNETMNVKYKQLLSKMLHLHVSRCGHVISRESMNSLDRPFNLIDIIHWYLNNEVSKLFDTDSACDCARWPVLHNHLI